MTVLSDADNSHRRCQNHSLKFVYPLVYCNVQRSRSGQGQKWQCRWTNSVETVTKATSLCHTCVEERVDPVDGMQNGHTRVHKDVFIVTYTSDTRTL